MTIVRVRCCGRGTGRAREGADPGTSRIATGAEDECRDAAELVECTDSVATLS